MILRLGSGGRGFAVDYKAMDGHSRPIFKDLLMITIHAWNKSTRTSQVFSPAALAETPDEVRNAAVAWIDLENPTEEEEQLVLRRFFGVHTLSLEDITRMRREPETVPHFPKVEEFPDYLFIIVSSLTHGYLEAVHSSPVIVEGDSRHPFTQLSAILTQNLLITHHYEPIECITHLRTHLHRNEAQAERGPDYLFHLLLDCTVDQFVPVLDHMDEALDHLEINVVQKPRPTLFLTLMRLKRQIILLRKTLVYEREVLVRLARGEFALVNERESVYYRNVYDHLVRFSELFESSREMVSDLMQSYLAATSNKLNEIMKVLTMISTVVLPMTLIAGVYGMNFHHMPELEWTWGYPFALGLMLLTAVGSFLFFHWRKWL